jgi:poly(ADP-ribose) glycohydrolase ARH3
MERRSKARGALLGAALGDALGCGFEGHPAPSASEVRDVLRAHGTLRYTDDTAMTIALAESLVAVSDLDEDHLAATFARHWHAEHWRGYGRGTASLLRAIDGGGSWRELAPAQFEGGSYGNGAAMRVAPVAILAGGDIHRTLDLARRSAQVTHAHLLGIDGAALQAGVVALALASPADEPLDPQAVLAAAADFVTEEVMQEQLTRVGELAAHALPAEVATHIGHGVDALSSVPAALVSALLASGSMSDTIRYAIAIGGDTDTIASMAAGITGAHLGAEAIPDAWLARLESRERLIGLADGLVRT